MMCDGGWKGRGMGSGVVEEREEEGVERWVVEELNTWGEGVAGSDDPVCHQRKSGAVSCDMA